MLVTAADLDRAMARLDVAISTVQGVSSDTNAGRSQVTTQSMESWFWVGPQGDDVRRVTSDVTTACGSALTAWNEVGQALTALRTTASSLHTELVRLESNRAQTAGFLGRLRAVLQETIDDLTAHESRIDRQADELGAIERGIEDVGREWRLACQRAATVLHGATAAVTNATPGTGDIRLGSLVLPTGDALHALELVATGALPSPDDASAVRDWIESLTTDQRLDWLVDAPTIIGNTDGIPYGLRAAANRTVMQDLLDSLPDDDPLRQTLEQFVIPGTSIVDARRKIIFFDPAGDGRVAELLGDPATASNVAVLVPGMGSTMANFTSGVRSNAVSLFESSPDTAVIAWTGYDAPAGAETLRLHEVMQQGQGRDGGAMLASFIDGLDLEHGAPTTVIGHSYGSFTVGQGLLQGVEVDTVVFIGSPGVGVDHVDDFPPGAADRYFAGEIDGDPVATLEHFGDAPTDPDFGATTFDAGSSDSFDPIGRHSEYYNEGPGLSNLTTIVQGGDPTPDRPRPIEHVLEFAEDAGEVFDRITPVDDIAERGIDWALEHVVVPGIDRQVDDVIDFGQALPEKLGNAGGTVLETADNLVGTAADKTIDFIDDVDLTFWN